MNKTPQFSELESLNYDIQLAILGACDSFEDLAALVQASPTLFHTFLSNKAPLLLSVAGNILGPATRDTAVLAKASLDKSNGFIRHVDQVVHDYKSQLRVAGPPWVTGLDDETVVALTHIARHTRFCVDMFGHIQSRQLIHDLVPAEGNPTVSGGLRLSRNERIRIARAILRRQVIISWSRFGAPVHCSRLMKILLPLFRTWEWQQISDMERFMSFLMFRLNFNGVGLLSVKTLDLEGMVPELKNVLNYDDASLDSLGSSWFDRTRQFESYGYLHCLQGSHPFGTPLLNDSQPSNTLGDDVDSSLESDIDDQPWAWRDALCGKETCRWGSNLVEAPHPGIADHQQWEQLESALLSWRLFGMIFWDRERVERLKQKRELEMCQTGWLVPRQD